MVMMQVDAPVAVEVNVNLHPAAAVHEQSSSYIVKPVSNAPRTFLRAPHRRKVKGRSVRFCDGHNETYVSPGATQQDMADSWYTPQDYQRFHHEARSIVEGTFPPFARTDPHYNNTNPKESEWAALLWHVYRAFRIANNPAQVQPVLEAVLQNDNFVLDETNVGLERMALPDVMIDYHQRRQELLQQVRAIQQQYSLANCFSLDERDAYLAQLVGRYGRVSRLYARWTAHLAAGLLRISNRKDA